MANCPAPSLTTARLNDGRDGSQHHQRCQRSVPGQLIEGVAGGLRLGQHRTGLVCQTEDAGSCLHPGTRAAADGPGRGCLLARFRSCGRDVCRSHHAEPLECGNQRQGQMHSSTVKTYLPWVVAAALFMEQLDSTIVNTAVPAMAASLQVTPLSLKAVVTSYILSLAVCIPVSGWMADRFGTRRVFSSAVAIFTLASILCGLAANVPMLVAARILQGIGAAMMMPVGRLAIIRTFPKSELLMAMNFVIIPALIGPLLGPTVGGLIVHWLLVARHLLRQRAGGPGGAVAGPSAHAGLSRRCAAAAGCRRPGAVRQRHRAAVLAAGNLRRASTSTRRRRRSCCSSASACWPPMSGMPARRPIRCCAWRCFGCAPSASRWSAASSRGWASAGCRFCCRCSTSSASACRPGSRAC